ncbi:MULTISPECIES: hypothetical protein [Corallococcus]|uniref:hypothetical protein n=1 Tax=Corallococcus TaxID=83461 RepID=UPI00117D65DA|nr:MULTISPECIES: hypothetical protein [Corallococcus]NBD13201.1 hypothetical protein [Corallococcus silvisoli]TSC23334.1 hypothetical protein FOF48_29990 [Corallococcus sp. Z5C101001]
MGKTAQSNESPFGLQKLLPRMMTEPGAPARAITAARELLELDERLDHWFLTVAKPTLGPERLLAVLEESEQVEDAIQRAWDARQVAGWEPVCLSLESGLEKFSATLKSAPNPGPV